MGAKNRVEVRIHGKDYVLVGTEPEEYIQKVALYIDKKMNEASRTNPKLSTGMIAVLAAINVADEYMKNQELVAELKKELAEKAGELEKVRESLKACRNEINAMKDKITEQQLELVKTKTEFKDFIVNHSDGAGKK